MLNSNLFMISDNIIVNSSQIYRIEKIEKLLQEKVLQFRVSLYDNSHSGLGLRTYIVDQFENPKAFKQLYKLFFE